MIHNIKQAFTCRCAVVECAEVLGLGCYLVVLVVLGSAVYLVVLATW